MKTPISIVIAVIFAAVISTSYAGPDPATRFPAGFPTRVANKEQAEKCCLPGEKVALACKDCKTVNAKSGEDKKGIMAWFKPDSTHDCAGCGGKITVHQAPGGKGVSYPTVEHVCSKCSPKSAFTCATHKG